MTILETDYNIFCKYCGETKPKSEFQTRAKLFIKKVGRCRECYHQSQEYVDRLKRRNKKWRENPDFRKLTYKHAKKYRDKNKDMINAKARKYHRKQRVEVIVKYGGKCSCCGETRLEFLAIDHINGGGREERKKLRSDGIIKKLLSAEGILDNYQVLCHNCNMSKGFYGYCPHTDKYQLCLQCQHTPHFCGCN